MTRPLSHDSLTVPLPLEQYTQAFDDLFRTHPHPTPTLPRVPRRAAVAPRPQQNPDHSGGR
jgi:hypothetical protein